MSFDSRIEWMEMMCDLMCGNVEEDFEEDENGDDRSETLVGDTLQDGAG